jgi:hypothetical protein
MNSPFNSIQEDIIEIGLQSNALVALTRSGRIFSYFQGDFVADAAGQSYPDRFVEIPGSELNQKRVRLIKAGSGASIAVLGTTFVLIFWREKKKKKKKAPI